MPDCADSHHLAAPSYGMGNSYERPTRLAFSWPAMYQRAEFAGQPFYGVKNSMSTRSLIPRSRK